MQLELNIKPETQFYFCELAKKFNTTLANVINLSRYYKRDQYEFALVSALRVLYDEDKSLKYPSLIDKNRLSITDYEFSMN